MNAISKEQFLQWAATHGLTLDPKYPQAAVLHYTAGGDSRFWAVPTEPQRRPRFITTLLERLGEWETCYVWRHLGRWPQPGKMNPGRPNERVEYQILRGLGLPMGTADVVCFSRDEIDLLITLIFSTTIFGWSVGHDLYIVPDHARQILQTNHHDAIYVKFREAGHVDAWVAALAEAGFALPNDLPDATFKRPSWMPDVE